MIILAAAIILSLSSNGIIDRANEAVDATDEKQMQTLASTLWSDAYLDYKSGTITEMDIIQKVKDGLYKVDKNYTDKYNVKFDSNGVELSIPEWKVLYDDGEETENGMLVLGTENLFNTTDEYRLTIESNGNEIQIETKLLASPEGGVYLFAVINGNTVIYPKSLEEIGEIIENNPNSVGVAGGYIQQEDGNICVLMFEDSSGTPGNYKIIRLETKERYIDEGWDIAYTCTNGAWSDKILRGKEAKGDIVAKFYKTDEVLTKVAIDMEFVVIPVQDSNAYYMTIEGNGNMAELMQNSTVWYDEFVAFYQDYTKNGTTELYPGVVPYVTKIEIKEGITNISNSAFQYFSSLTDISIPNSVTSIGEAAFLSCYKLVSIPIPKTVTNIGDSAFWGCRSLFSVAIPDGVTAIKKTTFYDCNSLTSISIPKSVTSIEESAICLTSINKIFYGGTETDWSKITIEPNNEALANATMHFSSN